MFQGRDLKKFGKFALFISFFLWQMVAVLVRVHLGNRTNIIYTHTHTHTHTHRGFPGGGTGKEPTCQCRREVRDAGSIPGSERYPGGRNANPLQYSCLENPMDKGAWQATVCRVAKSWT